MGTSFLFMEDLGMAYSKNNSNGRGNQGKRSRNGNGTRVQCSQKNGQRNSQAGSTRPVNQAVQVYHKGNRQVSTAGYDPRIFPPNPSFGQISYDGKFIFTSRRGWVVFNPNYKKSRQQNISFQQRNFSNDNRRVEEHRGNNHYHNCGNTYHVTKNVTTLTNSCNTVEKKKKKKKKKNKDNVTIVPMLQHYEPEKESSGVGKYIAAAAVGVIAALLV